VNQLEWLDDDRVPCISAVMGTDNFAHAFGCPVVYPGNNNPFSKPIVFSAADLAKIKKPKLENSSLMEIMEYGYRLQSAAPGALIQLPDIQSPLDIAALIWDKTNFFMAFYDEPQAVKDLISMCYELLKEFLDLWFKTFGKEFIAHYPDYYMPYGITLSEDEIGSINTAQFMEFSYPTLCKLSEHFGGRIGIHCCANARHQWEAVKSIPGLVMLNLVQPDNIIKEASSYFKDTSCQIFGIEQNNCVDPQARVVLQAYAHSKDEALVKLEKIKAGIWV
jgi:uroporphyrinogen-III decarboxylase